MRDEGTFARGDLQGHRNNKDHQLTEDSSQQWSVSIQAV